MLTNTQLTTEDAALLAEIAATKCYPIARFELRSSKDDSLRSIALPDVHLTSADDTMDTVKARGVALRRLHEAGFIRLDYGPAILVAADYVVYSESALFALLCDTVRAGSGRPDFLFDTPKLKKGRVMLTEKGRRAVR